MFLIDDILLAPIYGTLWVAGKIKDLAEKELLDEGAVKESLMKLQYQFELNQITEKVYVEQEKILLERLEEIRRYKEEHAR